MKPITRALSQDCARLVANLRCAGKELKAAHADVDLTKVHRLAEGRPYLVTGYAEQEGLLIMTLNVRFRGLENREEDNWENRLPHIVSMLNAVEPAIICFQEVLRSQRVHLEKLLGDKYYAYGSERSSPWWLSDESNPIFYRKGLVPELKRTVRVGYGRIFTHIRFPHAINVISTHWDARFGRKNQETLQAYILGEQLHLQHLFVLGDFNCGPIGTPLATLCTETNLRATCYQGTFNGWDRSGMRFGLLDNICVPAAVPGSASVVEVFLEGQKKYLSDHEPLLMGISVG